MAILIAGLVLFLGVHSISIVSASWRDAMAARIGERAWRGLYSLVALVGLVLIIRGYGLAREEPTFFYVPPGWLRYVAVAAMIFVFPLLFATYLPGKIKSALKHPMLVAVKLWAVAHLLVNGSVADVVLFGSLLAWAVADRISFKRRAQRPLPGPEPSKLNDVIAVTAGLAVYLAFVLGGHAWLFGVPALPGVG